MSDVQTTVTSSTGATRVVEGREIPHAGTWAVDASHTTVGFVARHLGVAKTRGRFSEVSGAAVIGERPENSSVEVSIATASVDSRDEKRDEHLRSADFFDVAQFPAITFRSTGIRADGDGWKLDGDLTIKGVTRPVVLDVEFDGASPDPWGGVRAGFTATTQVDREDWGLTWNVALETGGLLVGKKVKLELEVELVKQ
jgi:polyisoprenoid-binding protein YceI